MPLTQVLFFQGEDGATPVLLWLSDLRSRDLKAWVKCTEAIELLRQYGHELRRPKADLLREHIYELRIRQGNVNYRILYFFHGRNIAVLAHAITKEAEVPASEIDRAILRMRLFKFNPERYTYETPTT
jgi:phage-related protein